MPLDCKERRGRPTEEKRNLLDFRIYRRYPKRTSIFTLFFPLMRPRERGLPWFILTRQDSCIEYGWRVEKDRKVVSSSKGDDFFLAL